MNIDEAIMYAIKTSHAIKDEKKEQLTDYFCQIQQENQKYKEVINKAINYINGAYEMATYTKTVGLEEENIEDLLDILKEVEHE